MNEALQKNVEAVLTGADGIPLGEIDSRLEELQKELLKVANTKVITTASQMRFTDFVKQGRMPWWTTPSVKV